MEVHSRPKLPSKTSKPKSEKYEIISESKKTSQVKQVSVKDVSNDTRFLMMFD